MARQVQKKRVSIELGEGIVIEVDLRPVYSGVVVQPPPPKKVARVLVNLDEHGDWDSMTLGLDIEVAVRRKTKARAKKAVGAATARVVAPKKKAAPRPPPGKRSAVRDAHDRFANIEVD
ncbi:hypothetical protein H1235_02155 [Pseudoxanthomonas sp. NC8]|nr:hypothetical protein H1235_02155 [Pseudoxanthomonas sp. NC8]